MRDDDETGELSPLEREPDNAEHQAQEFREAMMDALRTVNIEIKGLGGRPQTGAVLTALASVAAEFITMQRDRNQRRLDRRKFVADVTAFSRLRDNSEG